MFTQRMVQSFATFAFLRHNLVPTQSSALAVDDLALIGLRALGKNAQRREQTTCTDRYFLHGSSLLMPGIRDPSITQLRFVRDTFIMLRALSILDFEPFQLFCGGGRESDLSKLLLTLSIHLHSCKGWPPPSTLSSRPERTPDFLHRGTAHGDVCGFLRRKPHRVRQRHEGGQEIRGSAGEGPAVSPGPHANTDKRSTNPTRFSLELTRLCTINDREPRTRILFEPVVSQTLQPVLKWFAANSASATEDIFPMRNTTPAARRR